MRNELSPAWTAITIVEHDEDGGAGGGAWTPLRIAVRDAGRRHRRRRRRRGGADADADIGKGGGSEEEENDGDDDPSMGEADVEVGGALGAPGREVVLELARGGR
jgi:hypothetical protein